MSKHTQHRFGKPIRVGMIGGGVNSAVGRVHEIALKMDGEFELQAGCFSRDAEFNADSGRQYGVAGDRVYPSAEHLIQAEANQLDAVVIATPIDSHADYIHLALDHGLAVISDKPLLANVAQCRDLLTRVNSDTTEVFSVFNYTGYPVVREMKARIEQGQIGQVFRVMAEMPQDSYMRLKNQNKTTAIQDWRLRDAEIACVSLDLFVHLHSLVNFLCKAKPLSVNAWSRSISGVSPGLIDDVDAVVRYENNLLLNAWYGKAALGQRNGLRIRVFGTQGSLEWYQEEPELLRAADALGNRMILDRISTSSSITPQGRYQRFKAGHPAGFIEAFANYYTDIARALREGQLNPYTLSVGVATEGLELAQAIARASATGQTIELGNTTHTNRSITA
ncbi:MAG TPA: Gfo/Idh/MocA family oxidoreductase [Limnobacter sp.]|uniref:Gfo/Idh/MocA family protein n=1 Tax=Limnobacter sp. TaxID=2003368 RepID=UPI002ED917AF